MKKQAEDEKPQGAEERGLVMASRVLRRNITISTKAKNRTLQESFSKDLVLVWGHMDQRCNRIQYTRWAYMQACSSRMGLM